MRLRGIIMKAELIEPATPVTDEMAVEMLLWLQGVGPAQPRRIIVPFSMLLENPALDPERITGHGFEAEVEADDEGRWIVQDLQLAARRVLRPDSG
jgi:hypothetical protein